MSAIGQGSISVDDNAAAAENAQETANQGANGVNDINSDNKLTPSEKLTLKRLYDTDVLKHDFDVQQLTSMSLPTVDIDTALNNLTAFTATYFSNMEITETVDRQALNKAFNDFENADKAVENLFNDAVQQVADDAKTAGEDAKAAGEDAKASAEQAKTDAEQAKSDAQAAQDKAQSSIDQLTNATTQINADITDAKNSAQQALDNVTVIDSEVTNLSSSTTAQFNELNNGYQEVISTVNNMDIGGRNLILDSSNMSNFRVWQADGSYELSNDKKEITVTSSHGGINIEKKSFSEYLPNNGDIVVISADVKGTSHIQFNYNSGDGFVDTGTDIAVTSEYKRYHATFEWNPTDLDKSLFVVYTTGAAGQSLTVKNIKIEIGNKNTDWSPAPEDFASQTQITTLNNLINQKVSNDQYQSDKTQTADLINETVTKIDSLTIGGTNLVKNSKFDNDFSDWRLWGSGGENKVVDASSDWDSRVKKLAHITDAKGTNQFGIAQDNIPVEANTTYTLYVRRSGTKGKLILQHGNGKDDPWEAIEIEPTGPHYVYTFKTSNTISTNIYIGFQAGVAGEAWVSLVKLEKGSKPTDWSLSPFDTATSAELNIVNNAVQLKANSSDVTSQIDVAVQGVQTDVTNKVSNLTSQINQTANTVQILNTTSGVKNLVYNSRYKNMINSFPEGWTKSGNNGEDGYFSTNESSSYQGVGSIGTNTNKNLGWNMFAQSKPMPLAVDNNNNPAKNVYSGSMQVLCYGGGTQDNGRVHVVLAFYDANKKRIESNIKGVWSKRAKETKSNWELVKVEGLAPASNAKYVAIQAFAYGDPTHAMVNQPMINVGKTVAPYRSDEANQSDITTSIGNIHMGVKNADGSTSTFNMNSNTILLDANKIILNGNTSIQNATIGTAKIADGAINNAKIANAAINDAKISNLNGNKITAGTITAKQLNAGDIIANVINGKTITGITITTPNLQLGTNGTLTEDWTLNQGTGLFNPKKGSGTMTLSKGILGVSGNVSRWWAEGDGYWYGIGDDGNKVKNGSNKIGDNYGAGYVQHNIFDSKGATILRTYMDATGIYMNGKGTTKVNTLLTQAGLTTTDIYAMGTLGADGAITGDSIVTQHWIDAGVSAGHGIRIGQQTIQSHNSQNVYFNGDDNKQSVTLHAKAITQSSQLSRKKDIRPLDQDYAMQVIRDSDMYAYRYNEESPTEPLHYSGIIDDVNGVPQFKMPEEFISEDRTGRNDGNTVAFLVEALKQADKRIGILEGMMIND